MVQETPKQIWVITGASVAAGARSSEDTGGKIGAGAKVEPTKVQVEVVETTKPVEVEKLKQEMKGFLLAMQEILEAADSPNAKMQLDEVELSVEITGEGQVKLFGIGAKTGSKGAITLKFKRK